MSFSATTHWLMIAGQHDLHRLRQQHDIITWDLRMPMAYAASAWPVGTAWIPARNTSASTAPL